MLIKHPKLTDDQHIHCVSRNRCVDKCGQVRIRNQLGMCIEQFILLKREPWVSADDTVYPRNTWVSLDALHIGIELADVISRQDITLSLHSYENRCCLAIIEAPG